MNKTLKVVAGVILVYLFGWISGALSSSIIIHHREADVLRRGPEAVATVVEKRLTRNLDLDAGQQQKLHDALVENVTQRWALQKQLQPQVQAVNHATMQEISAALQPAQLEQFRANLRLMRERSGRSVLASDSGGPASDPAIGGPAGK
jgi:hypothetical protein